MDRDKKDIMKLGEIGNEDSSNNDNSDSEPKIKEDYGSDDTTKDIKIKDSNKENTNLDEEYNDEDEEENLDDIEENDEFDDDDEIENDPQEDEIKQLNSKLNQLQETVDSQKFARVDSKPEFASEVINIGNNQKVANLEEDEIEELLEKRKFVNLLSNFGWTRLAKRILMNVRDVENYSLSDEGMLIKNVMTEQAKTAQYTYEQNKSKKGRFKK